MGENLDLNENDFDNTNEPKLWPVSGLSELITTNTTTTTTPYTHYSTDVIEEQTTSKMHSLSKEHSTSISSNEIHLSTHQSSSEPAERFSTEK